MTDEPRRLTDEEKELLKRVGTREDLSDQIHDLPLSAFSDLVVEKGPEA